MSDALKFCRPEEVGVNPKWVEDYVKELNNKGIMSHSFLFMRHGKVFAEGYWKPFHKDWLHRLYSSSKTFVSAAIGMLADEGRIKLDDKIADYFPDQLPENPHPWVTSMTIRNLLMMATCYHRDSYYFDDTNWINTFFNPKRLLPEYPAGTVFGYDTSASYTLGVLVERLTGKTFVNYLKDKGLRELGFSEDAWCVESPEGYAWGGSGVMCTTRDFARFAMLFACNGVINGKRYLSEEYIKAATSKQIDNVQNGVINEVSGLGYGYQIWRTMNNSYSCRGMGSQIATVFPDQDFVFVCTGDTQGDNDAEPNMLKAVWNNVISKIDGDPIPQDDGAFEHMNNTLSNLEVVLPFGEATSPMKDKINGKTFIFDENPMGMKSFDIKFEGDWGLLCYHTLKGDKYFRFGQGRYEDSFFPETHYSGKGISHPIGRQYRCLHTVVWPQPNQMLLRSFVIDDYFGNMSAVFTFEGDKVQLNITKTAEDFMNEYVGSAQGVMKK